MAQNKTLKKVSKKKEQNKKQKEQDKALRNIFIFLVVVILGFLAVFIIINLSNSFSYNGVKFYSDKTAMQGRTLYRTSFPVYKEGEKIADYNFYLRTNPNELKNIPFNGNLTMKKITVLNPNGELNCDGDGMIAVGNIVQNLYSYLNISVIRDENATCDDLGRYSLINIEVSDVTEINQIGNSCYEIKVANCEILKATERYMIEAFVNINEALKKNN